MMKIKINWFYTICWIIISSLSSINFDTRSLIIWMATLVIINKTMVKLKDSEGVHDE
jgi:hypothetical protein